METGRPTPEICARGKRNLPRSKFRRRGSGCGVIPTASPEHIAPLAAGTASRRPETRFLTACTGLQHAVVRRQPVAPGGLRAGLFIEAAGGNIKSIFAPFWGFGQKGVAARIRAWDAQFHLRPNRAAGLWTVWLPSH